MLHIMCYIENVIANLIERIIAQIVHIKAIIYCSNLNIVKYKV